MPDCLRTLSKTSHLKILEVLEPRGVSDACFFERWRTMIEKEMAKWQKFEGVKYSGQVLYWEGVVSGLCYVLLIAISPQHKPMVGTYKIAKEKKSI